MSQLLPQIKIADLFAYKFGTLYARIKAVDVFSVKSKYANPPDSMVNVYKVTLIDEGGEIDYSDWCRKPGSTRNYKVGMIVHFAHAKIKLSDKIDSTTGKPYPPQVTAEKSTVVELMNSNGDAVMEKTTQPTAAPAVASIPVASAMPMPVQTTTGEIPTTIVATQPDYLAIKTKYPLWWGTMDKMFNLLYDALTDVQQTYVDDTYAGMMNIIFGAD